MGQGDRSVALVTGGASGIGLAIVRRFLAGGHRVAFVARAPSTWNERWISSAGTEIGLLPRQ